jgi:hypothetical protein
MSLVYSYKSSSCTPTEEVKPCKQDHMGKGHTSIHLRTPPRQIIKRLCPAESVCKSREII